MTRNAAHGGGARHGDPGRARPARGGAARPAVALRADRGDLVVTGEDESSSSSDPPTIPAKKIEVFDPVLHLTGNLEVVTKPGGAGGAGLGTLISAEKGTLSTVGDIITTDGGGLRIDGRRREARHVELGRDAERRLDRELGLAGRARDDHRRQHRPGSLTCTGSVQAKSIVTQRGRHGAGGRAGPGRRRHRRRARQGPDDPNEVEAKQYGNVTLFGDVVTVGGAPLARAIPCTTAAA